MTKPWRGRQGERSEEEVLRGLLEERAKITENCPCSGAVFMLCSREVLEELHTPYIRIRHDPDCPDHPDHPRLTVIRREMLVKALLFQEKLRKVA